MSSLPLVDRDPGGVLSRDEVAGKHGLRHAYPGWAREGMPPRHPLSNAAHRAVTPGGAGAVIGSAWVEAIVGPGETTRLHRHRRTEEIYHIVAGQGWLTVGAEQAAVGPGDTVCIPPGTAHCVENRGTEPLRILCCCSPPYSHADTELL